MPYRPAMSHAHAMYPTHMTGESGGRFSTRQETAGKGLAEDRGESGQRFSQGIAWSAWAVFADAMQYLDNADHGSVFLSVVSHSEMIPNIFNFDYCSGNVV